MRAILILPLVVLGCTGAQVSSTPAPPAAATSEVVTAVADSRPASSPATDAFQLTGRWTMRFHIDAPGSQTPTVGDVEGSIIFADSLAIAGMYPTYRDTPARETGGRATVDFRPFFGDRDMSSIRITHQAIGGVLHGDSVEVDLDPMTDHGPVSFAGRVRGDSIVGHWIQRSYGIGAGGTVVLKRLSRP